VVIVQADHAEYAELSLEQFPGASVVVDGRKVLDPARFGGASFLVVGQGSAEA
jgi:UDP-N-acetyl-D-mannosaminuronate dehydrogenase